MAVDIDQASCIACGACVDACPVEALKVEDFAIVDAEECIDCGSCVGVCPTDSLSL